VIICEEIYKERYVLQSHVCVRPVRQYSQFSDDAVKNDTPKRPEINLKRMVVVVQDISRGGICLGRDKVIVPGPESLRTHFETGKWTNEFTMCDECGTSNRLVEVSELKDIIKSDKFDALALGRIMIEYPDLFVGKLLKKMKRKMMADEL